MLNFNLIQNAAEFFLYVLDLQAPIAHTLDLRHCAAQLFPQAQILYPKRILHATQVLNLCLLILIFLKSCKKNLQTSSHSNPKCPTAKL